MSFAAWLGFLLAAILIAVTPGPGAVLSMSTGIRTGYWSALSAILGLQVAILIHLVIVAVGFGALIATSETAFAVVKFLGAAYLVWLGIQKWRTAPRPGDADPVPVQRGGLFVQGLLVNLTNPKAIIFIGALVPQFIDPHTEHKALAFILLGVLFNLNSIPVNSGWALAAGWMARRNAVQRGLHWLDRAAGVLFIGFGLKLVLTDPPSR